MAIGRTPSRALRDKDSYYSVSIDLYLASMPARLGHGDDLAILDRYPHSEDLVICRPSDAPSWAHIRSIQRRNGNYVISIPTASLNVRGIEDADQLHFEEIDATNAVLSF